MRAFNELDRHLQGASVDRQPDLSAAEKPAQSLFRQCCVVDCVLKELVERKKRELGLIHSRGSHRSALLKATLGEKVPLATIGLSSHVN